MNSFSSGSRTATKKPPKKLYPTSEEELTRRHLLRDVLNRLDYNDLKKNITHDRRHPNEPTASMGRADVCADSLTPAADVILRKIENILIDLRSTEETGSMRMKQIDISLAELSVCHDKTLAK